MKVIEEEEYQPYPQFSNFNSRNQHDNEQNFGQIKQRVGFEIEEDNNKSQNTPVNPKMVDPYSVKTHKNAATPLPNMYDNDSANSPFLSGQKQHQRIGQKVGKFFSHQGPLNLNFRPPQNLSKLDEEQRKSIIKNHEAKSQFEATTIIEIYENRIGASPNKILGYIFIALVIASGASFVPLGVSLDVTNPILKVSWRVTNLMPFLAVIGFGQAYMEKEFKMKDVLRRDNLINLFIAALSISIQQYCAIFAGKYTLMSHSVIFVNLSGPVIVGWRLLRKQYVHLLEIIGCGIALLGSVISILDHTSEKANPAEQNILLGDGVALIGSFLCALWMMKNEEIVQHVPPLYAMTIIMLISNFLLIGFGVMLFDDVTLDRHPHTGVFGFLNENLWLYVIFVYGFFTGTCNMGSYSMSCKYFSPLVIGTAVLFEPIGSQIIGCILGLDKIPGFMTFFGTFITLVGLFFVAKGGQLKAIQTQHI